MHPLLNSWEDFLSVGCHGTEDFLKRSVFVNKCSWLNTHSTVWMQKEMQVCFFLFSLFFYRINVFIESVNNVAVFLHFLLGFVMMAGVVSQLTIWKEEFRISYAWEEFLQWNIDRKPRCCSTARHREPSNRGRRRSGGAQWLDCVQRRHSTADGEKKYKSVEEEKQVSCLDFLMACHT